MDGLSLGFGVGFASTWCRFTGLGFMFLGCIVIFSVFCAMNCVLGI